MLHARLPSLAAILMLPALLACGGCSSLGLTLFPSGHFLTDQAEAVLDQTASHRMLHSDVPRELNLDVVPSHYLQPGDVLLIEPVNLDSEIRIPADQRVLADGSIDLGELGRVVVAGLTVEMCESLIQRTAVDAGKPKTNVNVRLLEPVTRFYVLGEVNSPGSYPLEGNETVLDGLLAAGGLTSSAAPCKILLARPTSPCSCRVTLPVCYREITQLGDTSTNYQLQPGDRIFVSTRSWCEEMKFWQASKTCSRCCGRQVACPDPNLASRSTLPNQALDAQVVPASPLTANPQSEGAPADQQAGFDQLQPANSSQAIVQEAHSYQPDGEPVSAVPVSAPDRLPATADGELEFGKLPTADRFEPLWIKSASPE